jgi:hypothetical protein
MGGQMVMRDHVAAHILLQNVRDVDWDVELKKEAFTHCCHVENYNTHEYQTPQ